MLAHISQGIKNREIFKAFLIWPHVEYCGQCSSAHYRKKHDYSRKYSEGSCILKPTAEEGRGGGYSDNTLASGWALDCLPHAAKWDEHGLRDIPHKNGSFAYWDRTHHWPPMYINTLLILCFHLSKFAANSLQDSINCLHSRDNLMW